MIALALGELEVPHGRTVWGALLVTGVFASALAYLIQVWAQRRISAARIALVFSLETVFAGIFGYWLADDRLGWLGWGGCAVILAGIVLAEPSAAATLRVSSAGGQPCYHLTEIFSATKEITAWQRRSASTSARPTLRWP